MPTPRLHRWNSRTKHDLIIEVWEELDCESVGRHELEQIQQALRERFGEGAALESPASIARTVADEGAVLRHPEVFDYDSKWREGKLAREGLLNELDFSSFSGALESLAKLDDTRREFQSNTHQKGLEQLRVTVASARKDCLLIARSKVIDDRQRQQAKEISKWLTVWLQSPELFSDWLDLRRRSPEFRRTFGSAASG
jgi:hypothetical protein